jgi:hypothetical protein
MSRTVVLALVFGFQLFCFLPAHAQDSPPVDVPDEFTAIIQQMQFDTPTRIAGRLLSFDSYDDAIWLEWTEVYSGRRWVFVQADRRFIVYPRDPGMMDFFRRLKPGTLLRMTIQMDDRGKRRVLELEGS